MFLNVLKKGRVHSHKQAMNMLRAVNILVRRCTSFIVHTGIMFIMTWVFYGFGLIPLELKKNLEISFL
jgi:hypothetical protein